MASIRFHETDALIENEQEVKNFLEEQEVIYEKWDIEKLPADLKEKYDLTDAEKEEILATFQAEINEISERRGYKTSDIISLSDANPNLNQLLENFKKEHHHEDDEVRFIIFGEKTPSSRNVKGDSPMSREGMNRLSEGKIFC